jgi:hypothetical protein
MARVSRRLPWAPALLRRPIDRVDFGHPSFDAYVEGPAIRSTVADTKGSDNEEWRMRVMAIIKGTEARGSGSAPDQRLLTEMGTFNEALVKAGVMLDSEGLHASARGARVRFSGATRTVTDGPFIDSAGLVAGYWLWQVKSFDEAIEWAKRCPNPTGADSEIEIRQVVEIDDRPHTLPTTT